MNEHEAVYREQIVSDYQGNPLIEALPPILSSDELVDALSYNEGQHDGERELDSQYRLHCVQRLFRYFQPLEQHVDIEGRFSRCIRQSYLHRNPLAANYAAALAQGHKAIRSGRFEHLGAFRPTAAGFTIIGLSGVGKTSAVSNILAMYPQVISHSQYRETPLMLKQVVWLKLDCPHDGSVKGLCMEFFEALDRALGTDYFEVNSKRGSIIDVLMIRMAQAARLHCLGVLVIDEIQHLSMAKGGGQEKMLNFFVTLVNTIGVPVVLIGTSRAMAVLQSEFRQARRGSGQGDLIWDRMKNDASWDIFVSSMWCNQWTRSIVPLTDDFKNALYQESQGIIDIAVKLYAMIQIRAIALGKETFAPPDFRIVAAERLGLVKPMLDALRSGDKKKIDMYGDIAPISMEDYYSAYSTVLKHNQEIPKKRNETSLSEKAVLKLLELGVEPPKAKYLAGKVLAEHMELRDVADVVRLAYRIFLSAPDTNTGDGHVQGDLRDSSGYAEIQAKGVIETEEW
ncbi:Tn7-like transposition protein C [Desulfosporosinus sp. I2]|uniref:ATP-binding protein n=1 Tax=Desulfosporosinus sp. I2 TaxID=1617025 RepID=UPI0005EE49FC|nr:ATP-binding protein [Desulfosporosinus sp. I2]KJR44459.1 Tn7-like transposition protein C [Desulfosporosinus sp. I2]